MLFLPIFHLLTLLTSPKHCYAHNWITTNFIYYSIYRLGCYCIDSNLSVTYNIGHKIFLGFIVISFLTILYRYKTIFKSLDQTNKMRILYYMVGYLGSSLYVFTTNMLLPLIFNTNVSSLFGPIGYILYSSFHLYAVLRYQLFDIRIVIKKGVIYFVTTAILSILIFSTTLFSNVQSFQELSLNNSLYLTIIASIIMWFYPLLLDFLKTTDRFFFQKRLM